MWSPISAEIRKQKTISTGNKSTKITNNFTIGITIHNWQTGKGISRSIYLKVWVCLLPFASIVAEVVSSYEVQRAKARVRPLISRHFVCLRDQSRPSPHYGKKKSHYYKSKNLEMERGMLQCALAILTRLILK